VILPPFLCVDRRACPSFIAVPCNESTSAWYYDGIFFGLIYHSLPSLDGVAAHPPRSCILAVPRFGRSFFSLQKMEVSLWVVLSTTRWPIDDHPFDVIRPPQKAVYSLCSSQAPVSTERSFSFQASRCRQYGFSKTSCEEKFRSLGLIGLPVCYLPFFLIAIALILFSF